ncbi:MAG TPA: ROK family protein [Acidobacteriaceae bacterium]|nr:ROK family protein [Acidobacteriaceae bacterium]
MSDERSSARTANKVWIGVDIGGTKTAVVLCSKLPAILDRVAFPTLPERGPDHALTLIRQAIHTLIRVHDLRSGQIEAIGVSCGGPLDRKHGLIQSPPNLPTWRDVPIVDGLTDEFKVDCRLENDANAGAIAEHRFGAGQGVQNMIFLTMGTGLGAGVILDGRLYHGSSDMAGEIGHVRLTAFGPVGYNKAGSVEGWASGGGIAQAASERVAVAMERGEVTSLAGRLATNRILTAKDVADAARQGDPLAQQIVCDTGTRLGEALAILVDLLNPELIVIGGIAMRMGDSLLTPARAAMKREALPVAAEACRIVPAALGERIGDIAAVCVAVG